jgi:lipoprotein-releasing system ATP-binding protein
MYMSATITMHKIYKSFNNNKSEPFRLENISTTFTTEQTYAITGSSGSGKTTLLHLIALLIKPDKGTIIINEKDSNLFSEEERRHFFMHTIGIVFQQPYVLPELSVLENSMLPGLMQGKSKEECHQKALHLLSQVDLLSQAYLPVKALSGGQQQRVVIARALFSEPSFLLMDEPTGSLDAKNASHIIDLILSLHATYKTGIIICTHDKKTVELMDHCVTLEYNNSTCTAPL